MVFELARIGAGLPVLAARDELERALAGDGGPSGEAAVGVAVVQAPPGTGKTTLVPPLVANLAATAGQRGRVVVTQPRRVAARAAARRLAQLSGTTLGQQVGFTVRGEQRTSSATRVEFCTTGVLVRRLLADPSLEGVSAVVLDEVHERHLDADLAFAMVRELRELRPELAVVVMSATLDAERWAALLGDDEPAPVVAVEAELHELAVRWEPPPPGVQPTDERGVTPVFLDHLASTTARTLGSLPPGLGEDARVLVFVPGAREADRVVERLQAKGVDAAALSGRLDARSQDLVLSGQGPRVVVATAVAESSLTVPGVRVVVDAGLSREPRYDQVRDMAGLVTVREARSSASQRAGRAARLGPGLVVRAFSEAQWQQLRPFTTPEVATADLTQAVLDLACWGAPGGVGMALPDPLPTGTLARATQTLHGIGALDDEGRATGLGRRLAQVPADPRLARALLLGAPQVGARPVAEAVALLSGDERAPGGDLAALQRELRQGSGPASRRWRTEADRLERIARGALVERAPRSPSRTPRGARPSDATGSLQDTPSEDALALVVALAHPDRLARRRGGPEQTAYLTTGGTGLELEPGSRLRGQEWLAVADMARSRTGDGTGAVVRSAVAVSRELAEQAAGHLAREQVVASWLDGRVTARRVVALGAVELSSTPVRPTPEQAAAAVLAALQEQGLGLLPWGEGASTLRRRLALLHHQLGDPWPAMDDASLLDRTDEWLPPVLDAMARGRAADVTGALRALLPWPAATRLDELVPERLEVPSGSRVRLDYPEDPTGRVVLAVKLQECFGLVDTPRIVDGRVPVLLHLLSPARRPLAVTDDLASFWANAYPSVRAENRGRYARHPWPEDPLTAPPRRGTTRSGR